MTNAYHAAQTTSDVPLASGSEIGSPISSQKHENSPRIDAQNSLQNQTLLRSAIEDGRSSLSCDEDKMAAEESDEDGKYNGTMSRMTSLSKTYTVEEEKAIVRKFDRRLVLFMALLYMLSFLDRSSQALHTLNP